MPPRRGRSADARPPGSAKKARLDRGVASASVEPRASRREDALKQHFLSSPGYTKDVEAIRTRHSLKPASGTSFDAGSLFSSIVDQQRCHQDAGGGEQRRVGEEEGIELRRRLCDWLRSNKGSAYAAPAVVKDLQEALRERVGEGQMEGAGGSQTVTVEQRCQRDHRMSIKDYAERMRSSDEHADGLMLFAASRCLKRRIAVVKRVEQRTTRSSGGPGAFELAWEVWDGEVRDGGGGSGEPFSPPVLFLSRHGDGLYHSLRRVEEGGEEGGAEGGEDVGGNSGSESEDEDGELGRSVARDIWAKCTECGKKRLIVGKALKEYREKLATWTREGEDPSNEPKWVCKDYSGSYIERTCDDAAIADLCRVWWEEKMGKELFVISWDSNSRPLEELEPHDIVDISHAFVCFYVHNAYEAFKTKGERTMTFLARTRKRNQLLHPVADALGCNEWCIRNSRKVKNRGGQMHSWYQLFNERRSNMKKGTNESLMIWLLNQDKVRETAERWAEDVRVQLRPALQQGPSNVQQDDAPAPIAQLPEFFDEQRKRLEHVDEVTRAMMTAHEGAECARRDALKFLPVEVRRDFAKLAEATAFVEKTTVNRRPIPWIGNTKDGKSHTQDNMLRMSENNSKAYVERNRGLTREDLESVQYLREQDHELLLEEEEGEGGGGMGSEGGNGGGLVRRDIGDDIVAPDDQASREFFAKEAEINGRSMTVEEREMVATDDIEDFCMNREKRTDCDSIETTKPFELPYMLPVLGKLSSTSTTAVSIDIRFGTRTQMAAEYKTMEQFLEECSEYDCSDRVLNEANVERNRKIEEDVMAALGGDDEEHVQELLKKGIRDLDLFPAIKAVAGKTLAFIPNGTSNVRDRVWVRRLLHHLQNVSDSLEPDFDVASDLDPLSPKILSTFDGNKQKEFGARTLPALEKITLWVDCSLVPRCDGQWVDTAGCDDGNPRKAHVLKETIEDCDMAIILARSNLEQSKAAGDTMGESRAFKKLVDAGVTSFEGGVSPSAHLDACVCVVHNREMFFKECNKTFMHLKERSGNARMCLESDNDEKVKKQVDLSRKTIKVHARNRLNRHYDYLDGQQFKAVVEKCCKAVSIVNPSISLAASLIMNANLDDWTEAQREAHLKNTHMYETLGTMERFLKRGSEERIVNVLDVLGKDDDNGLIAKVAKFLERTKSELEKGAMLTDDEPVCLDKVWGVKSEVVQNKLLLPISELMKHFIETQRKCSFKKLFDSELAKLKDRITDFHTLKKKNKMNFVLRLEAEFGLACKSLCVSWLTELQERLGEARGRRRIPPQAETFLADSVKVWETFLSDELKEYSCGDDKISEIVGGVQSDMHCTAGYAALLERGKELLIQGKKRNSKKTKGILRQKCFKSEWEALKKEVQGVSILAEDSLNALLSGVGVSPEGREPSKTITVDGYFRRVFDAVREDVFKELSPDPKLPGTLWLDIAKKMGLIEKHAVQGKGRNLKTLWNTILFAEEKINCLDRIQGRAEELPQQVDRVLAELKGLRKELKGVVERWRDESTEVAGKRLADIFRRERLVDWLQRDGRQSLLGSPGDSKFIDETKEGKLSDPGYRPIRLYKSGEGEESDIAKAKACKFGADGSQRTIVGNLSVGKHLRKLEFRMPTKEPSPNHMLRQYIAQAFGKVSNQVANEEIRALRKVIALSAAIEAGDPYIEQCLREEHDCNVLQYREQIVKDETYPDILAVYLLVQFFQRPCNIYCTWSSNPIRIDPKDKSSMPAIGYMWADALVCLGCKEISGKKVQIFAAPRPASERKREQKNKGAAAVNREESRMSEDEADDEDMQTETPTQTPGTASPVQQSLVRRRSNLPEEYEYVNLSLLKNVVDDPQKLRDQFALFAERFTFVKGKKDLSHKRGFNGQMPCDDAVSSSDNFVGIFDGVGNTGVQGGQLARVLAEKTCTEAKALLEKRNWNDGRDRNRSAEIFYKAHDQVEHMYMNSPNSGRDGKSTATVLSLVSLPKPDGGRQHLLQEFMHGDTQWALLRRKSDGHLGVVGDYECVYLSPPLMHPPGPDGPPPYQLGYKSLLNYMGPDWEMGESKRGSHEVKDDDIVVAGSDGLWDNLYDRCFDPHDEGRRRREIESLVIKATDRTHTKACAVCNLVGRPSVQCIGHMLQEKAVQVMSRGWPFGKKDDLSFFVARISTSKSAPDMTHVKAEEAKFQTKYKTGTFHELLPKVEYADKDVIHRKWEDSSEGKKWGAKVCGDVRQGIATLFSAGGSNI